MGSAGDALAEVSLWTDCGDSLTPGGAVDDDARADEAGVEGNGPEPAVLDGLDEDVVGVRLGEPGTAGVVAVDGEVAEEGVGFAERAGAANQPRLPACIDEKAGASDVRTSFRVLHGEGGADGAGIRVEDTVAFAHIDAFAGSVAEENLVELGADDLEGVRVAGTRFAE